MSDTFSISRDRLIELREILVTRFGEEELKTLCFDLAVDYDDLPAEGRAAKSRELIAYMNRRGRLGELVQVLRRLRPDVTLPTELAPVHVADLPLEPLFAHPFPSQLDWTGQAQELDLLTTFWQGSPHRIVTIVGPSGLGKSSLARRWYDEFTIRDIRPDGFLWWSFHTQPDVDAFLTRALAYLTGGRYQRSLAPSIEAMVDDLISLSAEGRFLFVLDGLEIMQQTPLEENQPALIQDRHLHNLLTRWADPRAHDSRCLITSRFALPDLESRVLSLQIRPLSIEESCALLRVRGVKGSDADLAWLAEPYEGYPGSLSQSANYLVRNYEGDSRALDVREIFGVIRRALACDSLKAIADWGLSGVESSVVSTAIEKVAIVHLLNAAKAIKQYHERFERQEQQALLFDAARNIAQADSLQRDIPFTFSVLVVRIAKRWSNLIDAALEALRGEAKLKFGFVSDRAAFGEVTDLAIQVSNVGDETAEELTLSVVDTPAYQVVRAGPVRNYLAPGQSLVWEFGLRFTENRPTKVVIDANYRQRGVERGCVDTFADVITLKDLRCFQFEPFPPNGNPYNPGPPVRTDEMFYGRKSLVDKIIDELRGLHRDNIIVLYGQRRTGKTSLLYTLQRRLVNDSVYLPVFFDVQGVSTPLALFWRLALAITDACKAAGLVVAEPSEADFEGDAQAQFELGFLRSLTGKLNKRRLILMLDEFETLEESVQTLGESIFPFFRHLMQHQANVSFIFCGTHQLHELSRDYWSIFFNAARPVHVSFLDKSSTIALVTEPVEGHFDYDELALRRLWTLTQGHPYFTQYLCYEMVKFMSEMEKGYATIQDVNDALGRFIKLDNDHLVSYVWQESSEAEKAALLALLDVRHPAGERFAARENIAQRIAQVHPRVVDETGSALWHLIQRELLWGDKSRYGFTMELVAEWLKAKHSWYDLTGRLRWPGS